MKRALLFVALPTAVAFTTPTVVKWSATTIVARAGVPGGGSVRVHASLQRRWHIYSMTQKPGGPKPLSFEHVQVPGFSIGAVKGPKPENKFDAQFRMNTEVYSDDTDFVVPVRWTTPLPTGTSKLRLVIRYMACSDNLCLPPRKETLIVDVRSTGSN